MTVTSAVASTMPAYSTPAMNTTSAPLPYEGVATGLQINSFVAAVFGILGLFHAL